MPQVCTICSHEDRCEIDRALVGGTAKRRIAADFSVSESAVWRHFREHLPELLSRAYEAEQTAEADKLLTDISRIHVRTLVMLQEAEKSGDLRTALAAVREARNNISLLAELRGQLDRRPTLNLQVNAEWIEVRSAIVQALEPYSDAREAVVRAIRKAGNLAVREDLTLALDRVEFARRLLPSLDGWQEDLLRSSNDRSLLNCSRQAGKSSMSALIALHRALYFPGSLVLILAPSERQAKETFSKVSGYYHEIHGAPSPSSDRKLGMHLSNGSRIEALPGSERTVRGFSGVSLLVLDEASRVDDSLFHAVKPMLAVSGGAMIMLSTPHGKRGVFHAAWTEGEEWERYRVTAEDVPRISPEFLAQERKSLPSRIYRQEYECSFEDVEDQVFSYELVEQALSSDVAPLFDDPTLRGERGSVEEEVMPLF